MEKTNINRLLHVFIPFIIMVMTQNLLLLLFGRLGFGGTPGSLIAFVVAAIAGALFFMMIPSSDGEDSGEDSGIRPIVKADTSRCVMYLFFAKSMLIISMHLTSLITSNYTSAPLKFSPLYVFSLLVIHPIIEEYIFRGLFYGELRKINPVFGIIAQSIMFAIIHSTIDGMTYALVAGIFLGIAAEKTGRLWVTSVAHIIINARSLLYLSALADNDILRKCIDTAIVSMGILAFFILLLLRGRRVERTIDSDTDKSEVEEIWTDKE